MGEETSNPNLEWKKQGFENKEKLTLKTNIKKALLHEASDKKPLTPEFSLLPTELPKGLKKIRKKIKEVYDEDDESEEDFLNSPLEQSNSLLNALHEDEKQQLKHQQETLDIQKMQQNAGKLHALTAADLAAKELGLKGLSKKNANTQMLDVSLSSSTFEKAIREEAISRLRLRGRKLSEGETINLLRGIRKVQSMAGSSDEEKIKAVEGWTVEDLVKEGKKDGSKKTDDQNATAKKILKKSGRKTKDKASKAIKKPKQNLQAKNPELYNNKNLYRD